MSKRVLCKFFAHGACLKGEHCEYSHDWKDPPNNVCTFYQKGACSFGSRCRYNHVKVSRPQSSASSSSINSHHTLISDSVLPAYPPRTGSTVVTPFVASSRPLVTPTYPAWNQESRHHDFPDSVDFLDGVDFPDSIDVGEFVGSADKPICSFAAAGSCPRGEKCPHIHGELCPTCGKHCLHPLRPDEREEHMRICGIKQKHLEALKHSQEIECSVCLERVLLKPTPAERKFGLLSECDHPFCISCIRNWRSSSPSSGMDVNSALRSCPICRKLSYFVIPSVIWYCTKEEKQEIVESYKAKLRSIDCKYFDFGNGACPFGTSCFYKHMVKPGSYTWNNLRPPSPPRRRNSNMMGMEDILTMLEQLDAYSELEDLESFDPEDLGREALTALTPEEMSLLLMPMGLDTNEDVAPSQMALLFGQLGVYDSDDDL